MWGISLIDELLIWQHHVNGCGAVIVHPQHLADRSALERSHLAHFYGFLDADHCSTTAAAAQEPLHDVYYYLG